MDYAFPPDVQQLIEKQMASGCYATEDEVLRDALHVLEQFSNDTAAIQAAIDEWKSGDQGMPLDESFEHVRAEIHRKTSA